MPDRLTELRNLQITRVAFVPHGDNPHADVLIAKERSMTSSRDELHAAHVATIATLERAAQTRFPGVTMPVAVSKFVATREGRELRAASTVIHRAARLARP